MSINYIKYNNNINLSLILRELMFIIMITISLKFRENLLNEPAVLNVV